MSDTPRGPEQRFDEALRGLRRELYAQGLRDGLAVARLIRAWLTQEPDDDRQRQVREWADAAIAKAEREAKQRTRETNSRDERTSHAHDNKKPSAALAGSTPRWVSVDADEKPGRGDSVWVFDGECVVLGEHWGDGRFESYGASCDSEGLNSETLPGVTHWAELVFPEPPFSGTGKQGVSGKRNTQDQRLATADETMSNDADASPLHPLVRWRGNDGEQWD